MTFTFRPAIAGLFLAAVGLGSAPAPAQTLAEARALLEAGRPFHAHEVFEDAWKATDDEDERRLWHGMAQLAVGLTHVARGNAHGSVTLLRRGAGTLEALGGTRPHGIPVDAVRRWAADAADTLSGDSGAVIDLPPLDEDPDRRHGR